MNVRDKVKDKGRKLAQKAAERLLKNVKPVPKALIVSLLPDSLFDAPAPPAPRSAIGFLRDGEKLHASSSSSSPLGFRL